MLFKINRGDKRKCIFFTSNFMKYNSKTLESRFLKKLFLKKSFYNQIISYFFKTNNFTKDELEREIKDTPGIYIRKYLHNAENNLEKIKKMKIFFIK